jgi:hypothetical protein
MDISHITKLLSSLGKNQVTIPITSNDFIETKVDVLYGTIFDHDVFESLDDMSKEIQRCKGKSVKGISVKCTKPLCNISHDDCESNNLKTQNDKMICTSITHILACVNDNLLMFEKNGDKISLFMNSYLRSLINFVNEQNIKSLVIDDTKLAKAVIIQELSNMIEGKPVHHTQNLVISLSSKYLMKHIVLMDNKGNVLYSEFDYNNNDIEDVILIIKNDNNTEYYLDDVIKVDLYKKSYVIKNINDIKLQNNYKENLKSLTVKDLRIIAKKLCIDIVDADTSKLYSKVDLRLLIEAKINSI